MGSTAEGTATRQLIFWIREFEQLEMQFFVAPGTELEWFSFWKELKMKWHKALGFPEENCRFHDHDKLAHHANAASDIECRYPFGFKEVEGNHSRTGFALASHQKYSGKKIENVNWEVDEPVVPRLPAPLAPVKLAVFPLTKKDGIPERVRSMIDELKFDFNCQCEEKDSIGRRCPRQDTIRQKRVDIQDLRQIIKDKVDISILLKKLT
jgi:glycyl-tRNA synthetase